MTKNQKKVIYDGSVEMLEKFRNLTNDYFKQKNIQQNEFSQFYLFLLILNMDANVIIKQYCNVYQRWEEIVVIRQIYTLIRESTIKIIGIDVENYNKPIYWNEKLRFFVEQEHPNLLSEFDELSETLISYRGNEWQKEVRTLRNLSIHYDEDLSTENFFKKFNDKIVDDPFQLFGKWLAIICILMQFVQKIGFNK